MKLKKKDFFDDDIEDSDNSDNLLDDDSNDNELFGEDLGFDSGSTEAPIDKHKDLLSKLTNFEPYLTSQVMEWIGMSWDKDSKEYVKDPNISPIMNIKGARWCINVLRTYTRDNNIITTLTEDTYKNIMEDVIAVCYLNVGTRAEEFGITSNGDILSVCNQMIHAVDLILVGAGGTKTYVDFLGTATSRHETVQSGYNPGGQYRPITNTKKGTIAKIKDYLGV